MNTLEHPLQMEIAMRQNAPCKRNGAEINGGSDTFIVCLAALLNS
jgi:hypothetical protein